MMILPTVSAAITFTITPETQTVNPGNIINLNLNVNNDQAFWGFSMKIDETPVSPIDYNTGTPSARLTGSFNGITENTPDRITPYAIFAGNTEGITPGTGAIFTLTYTIPTETPPGTYSLTPSELAVSDQNGNPITGATITGASITVQETTGPVVGYTLPELTGGLEETKEVTVCLSNTEPETVTGAELTITHNEDIAKVTKVELLQGTGTSTIEEGSTQITITGLNVQNADCSAQTGANIAKIHYYLRALGTTPLNVQSATATPYSPQQFQNNNGLLQVQATTIVKSCEPTQGIITAGQPVTIRYKVSNPSSPPNIGGVDEQDTYDPTEFSATLPPTNLRAGSSLSYSTPVPNIIRTVHTSATQPFLNGPGTFTIYTITYTHIGGGLGVHSFGIQPPPPPALEVSDENHNDLTTTNIGCNVTVISTCTNNSDCDDGNWCNGQETCDPTGVCQPGTPPNCDDGNPCTNDYCESNACHHDPIPGCGTTGGGGGGGGSATRMNYFTGCTDCTAEGYEGWECCGAEMSQIREFCERPEAYGLYCKPKEPQKITPPVAPLQPQPPRPTQPEQPAETYETEPVQEIPEAVTIPEPTPEPEGGLLPWLLALLVILIIGGALGAYTIFRRKEEPEMPVQTAPPIQRPMPVAPELKPLQPIEKPKTEPPKPITPIIKKQKYDAYEASIRRRLAKRMKAKRARK
ncbi:hypothetical protein KY319_00490 [Candidatus Woesearchaeota archaeon]|nr:hypothetical protein [Candidatus Woesearchaeota archaeon]